MIKRMKPLAILVISMLFIITGQAAWAGIAVIANPANKQHGVQKQTIADMYLNKIKKFSNGGTVTPIDQPKGSAIRAKFYKSVLKMSEREVNRYWAKRKFTGKAKTPKTLSGDREIKEWVARNPEGLGYIDGDSLDNTVKVLLIIP